MTHRIGYREQFLKLAKKEKNNHEHSDYEKYAVIKLGGIINRIYLSGEIR